MSHTHGEWLDRIRGCKRKEKSMRLIDGNKLIAELPDFLCLKSLRTVHIQRQAGKNTVGIITFTDGYDTACIRAPANPLDHFHWRSNGTGGI